MPIGIPFGAPKRASAFRPTASHTSRSRTRATRRVALLAAATTAFLTSMVVVMPAADAATTTAPSSSNAGAGILRAKPTKVIEGDVTLTGNQSLKDTIVHGRVLVKGTNNVVENDIVTGKSGSKYSSTMWLVDTQWATNATVRYNTIKANVSSPYINGIGLRNVTAERNDISQVIDGIDLSPTTSGGSVNTTIKYNYIHDLMFYGNAPDHASTKTPANYTGPWANTPWSHDDGVQIMSGTGVQIIGNTISAKWSTSVGTLPLPTITKQLSAVMINSPRGSVTGLSISSNWLDYGEATINGLGATGSGTISGNRFGGHAAAYPMWLARSFSVSASGNVLSTTGGSVSIVWS